MDAKNELKPTTETKISKETKKISNTNTAELELITSYAQLVFRTLRHSNAEINDRTIRSEIKMFYEKFR